MSLNTNNERRQKAQERWEAKLADMTEKERKEALKKRERFHKNLSKKAQSSAVLEKQRRLENRRERHRLATIEGAKKAEEHKAWLESEEGKAELKKQAAEKLKKKMENQPQPKTTTVEVKGAEGVEFVDRNPQESSPQSWA